MKKKMGNPIVALYARVEVLTMYGDVKTYRLYLEDQYIATKGYVVHPHEIWDTAEDFADKHGYVLREIEIL